ncbi:YhgE/Pip domain-containing protein [Aeromicrobium sp. 636]|uniref:ABC transporter permease n=1 Tax=Aeromicrobium senzhongii TaxID=2663859 RepID=A0A8I0EY03_9ACTN|nr:MULTISPECIES: YhgE/Pip family protein [Aeromicrobium]MBC9227552.1 ABC transporter permease [Aeromicrobium senzhongii]MCQ3999649.1 YhgE/Pip domain-containing protein [Aeromicrobium sp. 636]
MTSLRLALTELLRLSAGLLPRLAIAAVILIPTLYASLYLWANHDPYGRLTTVEAALVVEDQPAESKQSGRIDAGREVARDLVKDGSFDWREVSAADADRGVENGEYLFALTIPRGFSEALASTADFDPKKGTLILTTNEANNYLSATIADQVLSRVSASIDQNVGEKAAAAFLLGFSTLHDKLQEAGAGAEKLTQGIAEAEKGSERLATGATKLADGQATLLEGQRTLGRGISSAASGTAELESGSRQVAAGNEKIATVADDIAAASKTANEALPQARADIAELLDDAGLTPAQQRRILAQVDQLGAPLNQLNDKVQATDAQIDELAAGAEKVANGTATLKNGLTTAESGSARLVSGQLEAENGARKLASGADELTTGLGTARAGSQRLATGLEDGINSVPDLGRERRDEAAEAIASPIQTRDVAQASADSYGAGLAPFFLCIGTWVGSYVMFLLVRPLSNRAIAARQSPLRTALGGWLTPALLAAVQVLVMLGVVVSVVGIDVLRAAQVALFLMLVAAAFVAIVHCLNAWLGPVGQFLGLVLLVLQLASAGGTFPWQTLPGALQAAHHVLPMSYAIDGIRHLMYDAALDSLPRDIAVLAAYVVGSVALTALAAYRRRIWKVSQIKPEIAL